MTLIIVVIIPIYWLREPVRQAQAQERQKTEEMERGAQLFASNCTLCHGQKGQGLGGPSLRDTRLDEDMVRKVVSRGTGAMPAWSEAEGGPLKDNQISDLVIFIKNWDDNLLPAGSVAAQPEQAQAAGVPAPTTPPATPMAVPPTPTQAAAPAVSLQEAGKLFAANCAMCHGDSRQGTVGPPLTPQSLAAKTDEQLGQAISEGKTGTAMSAWKAKLSADQISGLIQFLRSPVK